MSLVEIKVHFTPQRKVAEKNIKNTEEEHVIVQTTNTISDAPPVAAEEGLQTETEKKKCKAEKGGQKERVGQRSK